MKIKTYIENGITINQVTLSEQDMASIVSKELSDIYNKILNGIL
jgi:hypothetical protein